MFTFALNDAVTEHHQRAQWWNLSMRARNGNVRQKTECDAGRFQVQRILRCDQDGRGMSGIGVKQVAIIFDLTNKQRDKICGIGAFLNDAVELFQRVHEPLFLG